MTTATSTLRYDCLEGDDLREHLSNFLIDSWSYSAVSTFARNEKEFERRYIYHEPSRRSPSTVAGTAYHAALALYFDNLALGVLTPLEELQSAACAVIDSTRPDAWKTSATVPSVDACIVKATARVNSLLKNFLADVSVYTRHLKNVLGVELHINTWLTVNGVDIPLPCNAAIDLVLQLDDDSIIIIDHKSRDRYTDPAELQFTASKQAITYALAFEAVNPGMRVASVAFIENKHSANKDGSPQLRRLDITLDTDTRRLYEAILYEPLRRLCQAVSDPDYIYTVNDNDPLTPPAELYDFWARTIIADIDDFHIPAHKKELIASRSKKIRDASVASISPRVITSFRRNAAAFITYQPPQDMTPQEKIEHVLRSFNIPVRVEHALGAFSSVSYLLSVAAGVPLATISRYALDIAAALAVPSVRILPSLVSFDGRAYLCIEAPLGEHKSLPWDQSLLHGNALPIGIDNFGNILSWDLDNPATPHALICGATGSGKSVCIRSTIAYAMAARITDIIILDPKYEFTRYSSRARVVNEIADIENTLAFLVNDMQRRAATSPGASRSFTLIIFDELADAIAQARSGRALDIVEKVQDGFYANGSPRVRRVVTGRHKSLEENLRILLQKGRSLGFRIMAATQRASTKIITGDAKVNFPLQICFRVPKALDSMVVIDSEGAESLAGHGDGLMRSPAHPAPVRFQGFFIP